MERSDELLGVVVGFYEALSKGDLGFFDRHFSRSEGVRGIGTDPDEWWSGGRLAEVWQEQIEAMGGSMPLEPGQPEAYTEGTVGWVADRPALVLPDGGRLPLRFTAVFHREDDDWKLVQSHGSIGVANEETFGDDIPT